MLEGNFGKIADREFEGARGKHRGNNQKHFMHVALSHLVLSEFVNNILHVYINTVRFCLRHQDLLNYQKNLSIIDNFRKCMICY